MEMAMGFDRAAGRLIHLLCVHTILITHSALNIYDSLNPDEQSEPRDWEEFESDFTNHVGTIINSGMILSSLIGKEILNISKDTVLSSKSVLSKLRESGKEEKETSSNRPK